MNFRLFLLFVWIPQMSFGSTRLPLVYWYAYKQEIKHRGHLIHFDNTAEIAPETSPTRLSRMPFFGFLFEDLPFTTEIEEDASRWLRRLRACDKATVFATRHPVPLLKLEMVIDLWAPARVIRSLPIRAELIRVEPPLVKARLEAAFSVGFSATQTSILNPLDREPIDYYDLSDSNLRSLEKVASCAERSFGNAFLIVDGGASLSPGHAFIAGYERSGAPILFFIPLTDLEARNATHDLVRVFHVDPLRLRFIHHEAFGLMMMAFEPQYPLFHAGKTFSKEDFLGVYSVRLPITIAANHAAAIAEFVKADPLLMGCYWEISSAATHGEVMIRTRMLKADPR